MLKHLQRVPSKKAGQAKDSGEDSQALAAQTHSPSHNMASTSASAKTLPALPTSTLKTYKSGSTPPQPPTKRSLDTGLRKRLPLPYSRSAVRPSTSTSAVHATSSLPTQVDTDQSKNASSAEAWRTPEDADGAYVRRTYAHFDERGVRGDGLLEGKEWTRERGPKPVWESDEGKRHRRVSMPPTTQPFTLKGGNEEEVAESSSMERLKPTAPPLPQKDSPRGSALSKSPSLQPTSPLLLTPEEEDRDNDPDSISAVQIGMSNVAVSSTSLESNSEDSLNSPSNELTLDAEDEKLNAERTELLKKTDRYGFFPHADEKLAATGSGRSKIAILSIQHLRHIPRRRLNPLQSSRSGNHHQHHFRNHASDEANKHNGEVPEDENEDESGLRSHTLQRVMQLRSDSEARLQGREAVRAGKWTRMLDIGRAPDGRPLFVINSKSSRTRKLKERTYKGIPDRWRSAVWWALLCTRPGTQTVSEHEASYKHAQASPSPHDVQIDLDVPRTISGHILFHTRYGEGQRALFHVLHAFSLLCPDCGYCQGMGPIVATLLVYLPPERAYAVLVELHRDQLFGVHATFSPGFPGLIENFYAQSKLVNLLFPEVDAALDAHGIVTSAYATKWYITLFTNVVPFSTQLRIWDAFFLQGRDVLVVAATAVLWSLRVQLCHGSFETCMGLLGSEFIPVDDDAFLHWIYTVMQRDDVRKCLSNARYEWKTMIEQGKPLPIL